ncbi:MAG: hypothetical protein HYY52_02585 [Candidatus Melainabacteria bacterium]|nr:hypothetical protein [Candidatus Melainabacteria bacterium]
MNQEIDIKKTSLILVGLIWFLVGLGLSIAGVRWLLHLNFGPKFIIFLAIALSIGLLKGEFLLRKVALKYYKRSEVIQFDKSDMFTGCVKILGIKGFILISMMMILGSLLRHSSFDRPILGIIYLAVGIALVYASKIFFSNKE